MASGPIISWKIDGETVETVRDLIFVCGPKSLQMVTAVMKLKDASSLEEKYDQPRQHVIKQRHYFANEGPSNRRYGFSSSHVLVWELDCKESWCFWTVVLEKTLESPLYCKEIKPVNPKENQSWMFIGRTDVEVDVPILWPPDAKNWLTRKAPDGATLKAGGERDNRGWDGWMTSPIWWTLLWGSSGSWWWTGKPGVLQSMGSQGVGKDWATELNWRS